MLNFGPTFIWAIINLIILYIVLRSVLFKPVTKVMEERADKIKDDLEEAEKAKADAASLAREYEDRLLSAREEAGRIISEARDRAQKEYAAIISEARAASERVLDKGREQLQLEREQLLKDFKNQVVTLALAAASKVLEANVDSDSNRRLVDRFINKAGAA